MSTHLYVKIIVSSASLFARVTRLTPYFDSLIKGGSENGDGIVASVVLVAIGFTSKTVHCVHTPDV